MVVPLLGTELIVTGSVVTCCNNPIRSLTNFIPFEVFSLFNRSLFIPFPLSLISQINKLSFSAKFGYDRVKNAVHCTDLPEDGVLEVKYFFESLQKHQF